MSAWLKGLLAALAGGAVASVAQAVATGTKPRQLKTAAIAGAALTLGAYLTKSPIESETKPLPPIV
ncbi:MAG: hypothetical protein JWP63_5805 [Candidatus Solibacter sp.]|jgi:hypothetical protein|nr:hypothetical protein [Candidatus Solibacter sp.]